MSDIPLSRKLVNDIRTEAGIPEPGNATIREIVSLVNHIEETSGIRFVRMEMGVPGLKPPEIGTLAEIEALRQGVAASYPPIEGVSVLKKETSKFIKLFLDIDINPAGCIPTCGSLQGSTAAFLTVNRTDRNKEGTLFIDPGFPVHKQQCKVLGHEYNTFDIYEYRGEKLRDRLESHLAKGKISSLLYSNPNNPAWICLNEQELQIIGDLATKYDVIVVEDLAYFGMDFRRDISVPGMPPFQPTVAKYTDNYILLISTSKVFSYAGQRIALMAVSDQLFDRRYPDLKRYFSSEILGHAIIYGALYAMSAGACHSAQLGIAAILKQVNDGDYNLLKDVRQYGERANIMKKLFVSNGFRIVYNMDLDVPIADGFYFTISYPGFTGAGLLEELLCYGISAITLDITGSTRAEGLRACVSRISPDMYPVLEERLMQFKRDHS